jgi:hypothetical protein
VAGECVLKSAISKCEGGRGVDEVLSYGGEKEGGRAVVRFGSPHVEEGAATPVERVASARA